MEGNDLVSNLKGVGEKTTALFKRLKVHTVEDLTNFYPRYYLTYEEPVSIADAQPGIRVAVYGKITNALAYRQFKGLKITTCNIRDHSGALGLIWYNMPYMRKQLHQGDTRIFVGTPVMKNGRLVMEHPETFTEEAYRKQRQTLQPVYPLSRGLTNKMIVKAISQTVDYMREIPEYLPDEIIKKYHFPDYGSALQHVHFPVERQDVIEAKRRLIFDEFFTTTSQETLDSIEYKNEISGTGLGLSIVKDIVSSYRGNIMVVSPKENYSTCIRVEIPKASDKELNEII